MRHRKVLWVAAVVLIAPAPAVTEPIGHWLGHIDRESVPPAGLLGRIVNFVAGRETSNPFELPFDVAVADEHLLVLSRARNDVMLVDRRSNKVKMAGLQVGALISPVSVVGSERRVFVSDPAQSAVFVWDGARLHTLVDSSIGLGRPTGLALDESRGILWVVDTEHHKVLGFDTAGQLRREIGRRGEDSDAFNYPTFIAVAPDGSIVVNDSMNGAIKKFDSTGNFVWSLGGVAGVSPVFERAKGVVIDDSGRIFVVDNLSDCVVVISEAGDFIGSFGISGAGQGEMWSPVGIAVTGDTLIIADTQNHRLTLFAMERGD